MPTDAVLVQRLQDWISSLDAHLAHLSRERTVRKPEWDVRALLQDIAYGINALVADATSPTLELEAAANEARAEMRRLSMQDQPIPTLSYVKSTTTADPVIQVNRNRP